MKMKTLIVVALALLSLVLVATPADAVGTCNKATSPYCPGIVCYGYSNGHWQTCIGQIYCDPAACPSPM